MPDISTVANAFAVVGLADVVFRLGIEASSLYIRCRNASKNVPRLLSDLKTLTDIVAQVRIFADDYNQSPYVLEDSQILLPQLEATLEDCKRALEELKRIVDNVKSDANDGWFKQWAKCLSWALNDQEILRSCQQIEAHNVALNTALSLTGRQNEIVLRREVKATRKDVADAQASVNANFVDLQQHVAASSHAIGQEVQQVSAAIQSSKQANSTSFLKVDRSLASGHAKLEGINAAINGQVKTFNRSLSSANKSLARSRREQGALARQQKTSTSKLMTRLDDVYSLTQQIATVSLRETETNEIVFEGENLGMITLPLMLVQRDIAKAIRTLAAEGAIKVSRSEAGWIQEELENLLVCGHEAAALAARSRSSKACTKSAQYPGSALPTRTVSAKAALSRSDGRNHDKHPIWSSKLRTAHYLQQRRQFYTAAGILVVETGAHDEGVHTPDQSSLSLLAFRISFLPKPNLSSISMTASFFKQCGPDMEPKITRLVQTCNIIPWNSKAFTCTFGNDVMGLQKLFAAGKASPYDCDKDGGSLLMWAAYSCRLETYEYLLREGADALMFGAGSYASVSLLFYLWTGFYDKASLNANTDDESIPSARTLEVVLEETRRMTAVAIERGCNPNMVTVFGHESLLHLFIESYVDWIKDGGDPVCDVQFSQLIGHLTAMGCDLEGRNYTGRTPLLAACYYHQHRIFKIFADKGADVTALDVQGRSALHLLLRETPALKDDQQKHLRDALIIALVNGCDPNGLSTNWAYSPSDCGIHYDQLWAQWTEALSYVGYTLMETAEMDEFSDDSTWIVVFAEGSDNMRLPVSNMTVDDWKAERSRIRIAYFARSAEGSDNSESDSTQTTAC